MKTIKINGVTYAPIDESIEVNGVKYIPVDEKTISRKTKSNSKRIDKEYDLEELIANSDCNASYVDKNNVEAYDMSSLNKVKAILDRYGFDDVTVNLSTATPSDQIVDSRGYLTKDGEERVLNEFVDVTSRMNDKKGFPTAESKKCTWKTVKYRSSHDFDLNVGTGELFMICIEKGFKRRRNFYEYYEGRNVD